MPCPHYTYRRLRLHNQYKASPRLLVGRYVPTPDNPDKTAHIWTVVCCVDNHPNGSSDYRRFVQKHDGFYAPDANGNITAGVSMSHRYVHRGRCPRQTFVNMSTQMMLTSSETLNEEQLWFTHPVFHDKETVTVQVLYRKPWRRINLTMTGWMLSCRTIVTSCEHVGEETGNAHCRVFGSRHRRTVRCTRVRYCDFRCGLLPNHSCRCRCCHRCYRRCRTKGYRKCGYSRAETSQRSGRKLCDMF